MSFLRRLLHGLFPQESNCISDGHPLRIDARQEIRGHLYGPYLICERCGERDVLQPEPPADHPDSMTVELSEADEEFLAALDAELFPEEAW